MEKIYSQNWTYDLPGFIYYSELVKLIREKRIIPQNAMLNGKTKMDVENYYFQTDNMSEIPSLLPGASPEISSCPGVHCHTDGSTHSPCPSEELPKGSDTEAALTYLTLMDQ